MKKSLVLLFLLLAGSLVQSQELPGGQYDRYEIARNKETAEPMGIISAQYKYVTNDDYSMNDIGLKVGIFATDDILIGAHYFYLFDQSVIFSPESDDSKAALRFDYYGTNIDYFISRSYTLPVSVGLNIGVGQMSFSNFSGTVLNNDLTGDWVTVLEPEAKLYYHILPQLMASINFGYRVVSGVEYRNITNAQLSGLSGGIGVSLVLY